jgi:uncharacterized protein YecE (DUF72 family)
MRHEFARPGWTPAAASASLGGMPGTIRIGVGGWTFAPWRGVFYPKGLAHKRELEFASRALTSIEINGTYYSTFKPESWRKWRDQTPDGFVFAVKASRFCTNRKVLAGAGPAMAVFLAQGLTELGPKLGPINWQFAETKKFDAADFGAFLALLPKEKDGVPLRHAVEVRNPSFVDPAFYELCARHRVAIVYAKDEEFPEIDRPTADFTYARFMTTSERLRSGVTPKALDRYVTQTRAWAQRGDVFAYFISGAKVRNPAAAMALIKRLG